MRDDETVHISCLLRAVNCKTQDSFLVKVLYHLTSLCLSRRDYVAARTFLQRYVAAKMAAQGRLPADVHHWINESWYRDSSFGKSVSPILQMDYLDTTDKLLYNDIPERPIYVARYVPETRMATIVYGHQERGFIKLPKSMKGIGAGSLLLVRLQQPVHTGEKLSYYTFRTSRWEELPPSPFLKEIEGKITSNKSMTVFFVRFGKEFAFVPKELYKKRPLAVGERMIARIIWDYHKNRECWSWRCVSIKEKF